jgi:hypothetical protein
MKTNFSDLFKEAFYIMRGFGSPAMQREHFLLALLKLFPQSLAVRYMETIKGRNEWKASLQSRVKEASAQQVTVKKDDDRKPKTGDLKEIMKNEPFSGDFMKIMKNLPLEMKLLGSETIDENCVLLTLLRYQDLDELTYRDGMQFFKQNK